MRNVGFKSAERLVHNLVDRVSKNGYLLLNVGPRADGTIPEGAQEAFSKMGDWLAVNGEAIYAPWGGALWEPALRATRMNQRPETRNGRRKT